MWWLITFPNGETKRFFIIDKSGLRKMLANGSIIRAVPDVNQYDDIYNLK